MKFKLALTFLALSLCAAAQTSTNVPGVVLSGSLADPVLVNHSGKTILAAMITMTDTAGIPYPHQKIFANKIDHEGVPDGGSVKAGWVTKHTKFDSPIVSAKLHAVVFSDGEFRGTDSYESASGKSVPANFQTMVEHQMQAMRQLWQAAKAGDWKTVELKAYQQASEVDSIYAWDLAERLMLLKGSKGADEAVSSTAFYGNLPASTWKAGALNKRPAPDFIQALGDWFAPITAHAQDTFCCVFAWPQGSTMDAWHPNPWNYSCVTFTGYNNPCPPLRGITPGEGIKAKCPNDGVFIIGDEIIMSTDDAYTPAESTSAGTGTYGSGVEYLKNIGACYDFPTRGNGTDTWEYDKTCGDGPGTPKPAVIYDTSGRNCGATANGYHNP